MFVFCFIIGKDDIKETEGDCCVLPSDWWRLRVECGKDVGRRASLEAVGELCCDMGAVPRGHPLCPSGHCLDPQLSCDKDLTPIPSHSVSSEFPGTEMGSALALLPPQPWA